MSWDFLANGNDPEAAGGAAVSKAVQHSPEEVLQALGEKLGRRFRASRVVFGRVDKVRRKVTVLHEWTAGGPEFDDENIDLNQLLYGEIPGLPSTDTPISVANIDSDKRFADNRTIYQKISIASFVRIPYPVNSRLEFVLSVQKSEPYEWSPDEITLLRDTAERVFLRFERAEAEAALSRAVRFDEAVLGNMGEGLYTTDKDGALVTMNPAAEKILGWTVDELRGRPMHDVVHYKHRDGTPLPVDGCKVFSVLQTGKPVIDIDDVFVRKDGTFIDVRYTSSPLVESDRVIGLVVVFRDASERRQIENRIRESEARLQAMFGQAGVGVCLIGTGCLMEQVNPKFCEIVGYEESELLGRSCLEITHPDDKEENLRVIGELLETDAETGSIEKRYVRKDGTTVWVRINLAKIFDSKGKTRQLVAVVEDIDERKTAEDRQRESERRFARFMQHLPGLAWIKDSEGRYIYANEAAEKAFGISRNELYRKTDSEVFPPETAAAFIKNDKEALTSESGIQFIETLETKPGEVTESLVSKFTITGDKDHKPLIGGMAIDVTEQRQIQRDQEFLFTIADKIRTGTRAADLLAEIPQLVGNYLNVHRCLFNEIDLQSDTEIVHSDFSRTGESVAGVHRISDYSSVTSEIMMSGKTVVNRDSKRDPRTAKLYSKTYGPNEERSYVTVPMLRNGKWVASLWCSDDRPRNWTDREVALLENIAERIWSAVERLRAQEALEAKAEQLRESEERFRLASEAVRGVIYDWDLSSGKVDRSVEIERLLGFSESDPEVGTTAWWESRVHPDDFERARKTFDEAMASGATRFEDEYRIRHRAGHFIWVNDTGRLIRDADGRAVRCVGSVTDITERKRAEEALRESEQRFRYTSDAAPVLIWMADATKRATWFNKYWLDFAGRTMDEEVGDGWVQGIHPDDLDRYLEIYRQSFDAHQEFSIECRLRRADGQYRWMLETGVPRFSAGNEFLGFIGSCVDIHDRKSAAEALRESEERFQLAQSAGNVGVWDWDILANRTYWSDTMWRFYGEVPRSVNPDDEFWTAHLHPDDRDRVKENLERTIESSDLRYTDEFRILGAEGRTIWIESMANVVRRADGKAVRVYGVNLDITERKLNEERIKRNETQLRLVTDSLPALIAYVDNRKRYQFVNKMYSEWFGEQPADLIGRPIRDVVGGKAYRSLKPLIENALAGEMVSLHAEIPYKSIGSRFVHLNYVPDIADDGSVRGFFSLISDLTDVKRSEELLKSTEERIALLMENVADYAIFSINTDGIIETWNIGAEKIFGYSAEEIVGTSDDTLFTAEDVARGIPVNEMRVARQKGRATDERWLVRKGGVRFFANGIMMPLIVGKRLTGYAKIVSDLTERKRRAEALQSAHDELELRVFQRTKELGEMNELLRREVEQRKLSEKHRVKLLHRIVSAQEAERKRIARDLHDQLGQRLTALRLKLASLRDVCAGDQAIADRVERLQDIATMLDSEVSFLASELRPSILDDLGLEEALRAYARDWSHHFDIPVKFHSHGLFGRRHGREAETQVYRIAQEALNNVAKHAGPTEVTVMMEQTADFLMLIIEDTGSGFVANGNALKSKKGLGLVGMRERAALIGADLEIESAPGQGTTVFLRLPHRKRGQTDGR